jgi:hypothetical protein
LVAGGGGGRGADLGLDLGGDVAGFCQVGRDGEGDARVERAVVGGDHSRAGSGAHLEVVGVPDVDGGRLAVEGREPGPGQHLGQFRVLHGVELDPEILREDRDGGEVEGRETPLPRGCPIHTHGPHDGGSAHRGSRLGGAGILADAHLADLLARVLHDDGFQHHLGDFLVQRAQELLDLSVGLAGAGKYEGVQLGNGLHALGGEALGKERHDLVGAQVAQVVDLGVRQGLAGSGSGIAVADHEH